MLNCDYTYKTETIDLTVNNRDKINYEHKFIKI